jgi:glucose-6-phosphate dehydrogenase assembly protein OpcA
MGATVAPDRILRELSDLWVSLGKEGQAADGAGVLRACSMTLVVLAEEADDVTDLGETIAALMPEHPARTVLIRLRGDAERTLSERVYSQCWMPFGQRRQICCEQIEITASDSALGDLASVMLPLAVADLPVIVWCRSARLAEMPEFRQIAALADRIVLDSSAFPDARDVLRRLTEWGSIGVKFGDLAWTRLTRWREMLSQVFENPRHLAQLAKITKVRVKYAKPNETMARYMAAWIATALPHPEVTVEGDGDTSLEVNLDGEGFHLQLVRREDRLIITVNDLSHCTNMSLPTDYLLLREELGIVHRDPVFEKTLAAA